MKVATEASLFLPPGQGAISPRQVWAANRFWMEMENLKSRRYGGKSHHHWYAFYTMTKAFEWLLRVARCYERGERNAYEILLREVDLFFGRLPASFHGFTVLHLSDLHLDGMPGLVGRIHDVVGDRDVDLCVLTGDYRTALHGPIQPVMDALSTLVGGIRSRCGVLAVLGNHDGCHMVEPLEAMGVRVLVNESVEIERGGEVLRVVGTDDVHYYYTDQAIHALEKSGADFTIALVHSPELYDAASKMGVDLYLCGHTHGGQICLPKGIPIFKHLNRGRRFYRGHWSHGAMQGLTNCGAGTSGIPVRFNTRGEVLLLRLHRSDGGSTQWQE